MTGDVDAEAEALRGWDGWSGRVRNWGLMAEWARIGLVVDASSEREPKRAELSELSSTTTRAREGNAELIL